MAAHIALTANQDLNQRVEQALTAENPQLAELITRYQVLKITPKAPEIAMVDYDWAIFTSKHAVDCALNHSQLVAELLPEKIIAIGDKTQQALVNLGYRQTLVPETYNSEGLVAMNELQQISGQSILLVKGQAGRELIAQRLTERGASVYQLEVYKRESSLVAIDDKVTNNRIPIIVLAPSLSAVTSFSASLKMAGIEQSRVSWIALSERIAQTLIEQGLSVTTASFEVADICSAILSKADTINAN